MQCKKKKNKFICVFCSFLILVCGLLQSSTLSVGSYASSSSGSTMTVDQYLRSINFYDACAYAYRTIGSIPDNIGGGSVTFALFEQYLADQDKEELLQEPVTVVEGASGGRGYEVPQEVRQEMINFINTNIIEANPLSYTQCYISSYNYLNTSQFTNFQLYSSIKEVIKQHDLSFIMAPNGWDSYQGRYAYICCVDRSKCDINFYGSTTSGVFTNVNIEHNWSQFGFPYNQEIDGIEYYMFANNKTTLGYGKTIQSCWYNFMGYNGSNWTPSTNGTIKNTTGIGTSTSAFNVFTGKSKNELVYVFNTLNAYKNYNAGSPQPYYLLSDPNYIAPYDEIWTNEGLNSAGNFYNNIVNNVTTGNTPNQIQDVTRDVLNGVTGGNSGSSDSGFDLGFLGTIGEVIKSVTGAFTPVNGLITGELSQFISDVFGWLPQEIVILWVAGIIFAVLFGILKLIRG